MKIVAWMKGYGPDHHSGEYDIECYAGEDPPDNSTGWVPLVRCDDAQALHDVLADIASGEMGINICIKCAKKAIGQLP